METSFPAYRKFPSGKSWFKIISPHEFEEIQVFGRYYTEYHLEAQIYPDHVRIADMLACKDGHWEAVSEADYDSFVENCRKTLKKGG